MAEVTTDCDQARAGLTPLSRHVGPPGLAWLCDLTQRSRAGLRAVPLLRSCVVVFLRATL